MGSSCVPRVIVKFLDADVLDQWTIEDIARERQDVDDPEELQAILEEIRATVDTLGEEVASDTRRNRLNDLAVLAGFGFDFGAFVPERLLACISREELDGLLGRARERDTPFMPRDLTRYITVQSPDGFTEEQALAVAAELRRWPLVETAYVDQCEPEPPASSSILADLNASALGQPYLDGPGVGGINARGAGSLAGGKGDGIIVADIEGAWNTTPYHERLPTALIDVTHAAFMDTVAEDFIHGNMVLGVLKGLRAPAEGGAGVLADVTAGLAPNAMVHLVSKYQPDIATPNVRPRYPDIACAIVRATLASRPGDVLLLEVQWRWWQVVSPSETKAFPELPVEAEAATLEAIRLATALDRVVVEAAGNGEHNLDDVRALIKAQEGWSVLSADRDSGAILVGALMPARRLGADPTRNPSSNWGCRVDCWAPGRFVFTANSVVTGVENDTYNDDFAETSAAAAIVAGAVAALQGIARHHGDPLSPGEVRDLLRNPELNTNLDLGHCASDERDALMPDLGRILSSLGWA